MSGEPQSRAHSIQRKSVLQRILAQARLMLMRSQLFGDVKPGSLEKIAVKNFDALMKMDPGNQR